MKWNSCECCKPKSPFLFAANLFCCLLDGAQKNCADTSLGEKVTILHEM